MADSAISDGLYWVISADDTANAMDIRGGGELSGTEIQFWGRNRRDGQLVSVRNRTQDGQAGITLCFPLAGKYVDVTDGGTKPLANGTTVRVWDGNGSRAQLFQPVSQGRSATIDGSSYPVYKLRSLALKSSGDSKNYCLDGSGESSAAGTTIFIWEEYGAGKQNWCLVPASTMPLGVYRLRPKTNTTLCMDVHGGGSQSGANVQIFPARDQNNQRFLLTDMGEGLVGLACVESGLYADVYGQSDQVADGQNVWVYPLDGDEGARGGQSFALVAAGQAEVNGVLVDCYEVAPKDGVNFRLDAAGGGDEPEDNVQVWTQNGSTFQLWALTPDEAEATDVSAPTNVGLSDESGAHLGATSGVRGSTNLRPRWTCDGDAWKQRYRTCLRPAGGEWGDWSPWMCLRDGSAANEGFGDMWAPTERTEADWDVTSALRIACPVSNEAYDGMKVEADVRRFLDSWGPLGTCAHGPSGTGTATVVWLPTLSITSLSMGPAGLAVGFETDSKRGGHSAELSGDLFSSYSQGRVGRSGTVVVPTGRLSKVPADGEQTSVTMRLTTCDGLVVEASATLPVSWGSQAGSLSPTYEYDASVLGYRARCDGASGCWLMAPTPTGGRELRECERSGDAWLVLPPFGEQASVFWAGEGGQSWAVSDDRLDPIDPGEFAWVWGGRCLRAVCDEGQPPTASRAISADAEEHVTGGSELPQVGFGRGVTVDCSVKCSLIDGAGRDLASDDLLACALAASGRGTERVVFRDPWGFWATVAVTSVDKPRQYGRYLPLTVTQEAIRE